MRCLPVLFIALASVAVPARAAAFDSPQIPWAPRAYVCPRAPEPPVIDGRLDEPSWRAAPLTEPFVDIRGPQAGEPSHGTIARMLWDDEYFYLGAELIEPQLCRENDFEIFLDPDGDCRNYVELEINALNRVRDLLVVKPDRDGGPALDGWDLRGLRTAVYLDGTLDDPADSDRAWSVEIAIPWRALKECAGGSSCPPRPDDTWRVNFSRVEWPLAVKDGKYVQTTAADGQPLPADNRVWSPQGLVSMHYPERWGFVTFSDLPCGSPLPRAGIPQNLVGGPRFLSEIYYAQRKFSEKFGYFATTLGQLDLPGSVSSFLSQREQQGQFYLQATAWQFEARLRWGDAIQHVDHTCRLWTTDK